MGANPQAADHLQGEPIEGQEAMQPHHAYGPPQPQAPPVVQVQTMVEETPAWAENMTPVKSLQAPAFVKNISALPQALFQKQIHFWV